MELYTLLLQLVMFFDDSHTKFIVNEVALSLSFHLE